MKTVDVHFSCDVCHIEIGESLTMTDFMGRNFGLCPACAKKGFKFVRVSPAGGPGLVVHVAHPDADPAQAGHKTHPSAEPALVPHKPEHLKEKR